MFNGCLAAHVLPSKHPSWILLSLRIIFCPYLSQSGGNWLGNDGFLSGFGQRDEDAYILEYASALAASWHPR